MPRRSTRHSPFRRVQQNGKSAGLNLARCVTYRKVRCGIRRAIAAHAAAPFAVSAPSLLCQSDIMTTHFAFFCEPFPVELRLTGCRGTKTHTLKDGCHHCEKRIEDAFHDFHIVESQFRMERYTVHRRSTGEYAIRVSPALVTLGRKPNQHSSKPGVTKTAGFFHGVSAGR